MSGNAQLPSWHEYRLVALSIVVAAFSSYAAFDVAERMVVTRGGARRLWWAGGASAMAFGIWSMHYTGILALRLPVALAYDWPTAILSFLPAFAGSAVAFYLLSTPGPSQIWMAAIANGLGISGLHLVSMASMRLAAEQEYTWPIVLLSAIIAIVGSWIAMTLAFRSAHSGITWRKVMGALVMGAAAMSGMHYMAMAAVKFVAATAQPGLSHAVSVSFLDSLGIVILTLLIQALAMLTCNGDRQLQVQREISTRVLQSQDEERKRIAAQLHETVAQTLVALRMSLGKARRTGAGRTPEAMSAIDESISLADASIKEVRTISYLLQPPHLEKAGLGSALRWYVSGFQERSGIAVTLEAPEEIERLDQQIETAVFRVVQEALTNIHRHSGSPTATVRLRLEGARLVLEVEDAGRGMPSGIPGNHAHSFPRIGVGITGMQERVQKLGGKLEILSTGRGTRVTVTLPISGKA